MSVDSKNNPYLKYYSNNTPQSSSAPNSTQETGGDDWMEDMFGDWGADDPSADVPADGDMSIDMGEGSVFEDEPVQLTAKQERLVKVLEQNSSFLVGEKQKAEEALRAIQSGTKPQDGLDSLEEVEHMLASLKNQINSYKMTEDMLRKTGVNPELVLEGGISDLFSEDLELLQNRLDQKEETFNQGIEEEKQLEDNQKLATEALSLVSWVDNSKEGAGYYVNFNASDMSSEIAKSVKTEIKGTATEFFRKLNESLSSNPENWEVLQSYLSGVAGSDGAAAMPMVYLVLKDKGANLLNKLPSNILKSMSDISLDATPIENNTKLDYTPNKGPYKGRLADGKSLFLYCYNKEFVYSTEERQGNIASEELRDLYENKLQEEKDQQKADVAAQAAKEKAENDAVNNDSSADEEDDGIFDDFPSDNNQI